MKNLEQIRADHALKHGRELAQSDVNGLPALIVNNGLLATAAFAAVKADGGQWKRPGMKKAFDAVASHLAERELLEKVELRDGTLADPDVDALLSDLADAPDSAKLRRATAETLAYLNYLKRFAKPDSEV